MSAAVLAGAGIALAEDDAPPTPPSETSTETESEDKTEPADETEPDLGTEIDVEPEDTGLTPDPDVADPEVDDPADPATVDDVITVETASEPGGKKKPTGITTTDTGTTLQADPPTEHNGFESPILVEVEPEIDTALARATEPTVNRDTITARITQQPAVSMMVADELPAVEQASAPPVPNLMRWLQGVADNVVKSVGSLVLNTIQALEALFAGPPAVPASSPVTVRTSSILLANGQRVQANWYFPDVPDGEPAPDRLILLQHGFFALGPMYSHTAADLAVSTNSIVVTPTLSSNFFGPDDGWINGDAMWRNIADLFDDERIALTESAHAAGYVGALPEKFGLAGHSAGGQLVTAVAGYLVDNGAVEDLVGVITLDGVPTGNVAATALAKLQKYERSGGHYIPVREIGAPSNAFNSISTIKQSLDAARPGRFNGVVLAGGVHMDAMRGGNPLVQFVAYLAAGFPKPENQQAVTQLTTEWFNEWFAGDTDNGDDLPVGSTVSIITPNGTATGAVIKSVPAVTGVAV